MCGGRMRMCGCRGSIKPPNQRDEGRHRSRLSPFVVGALVGGLGVVGAFCDVTQILNSFARTWPVTWLL